MPKMIRYFLKQLINTRLASFVFACEYFKVAVIARTNNELIRGFVKENIYVLISCNCSPSADPFIMR